MKSLQQYIKESLVDSVGQEHRINEMAQVSDPSDNLKDGVKIWVYAENDEQGTKTPHFHVVGEDFEFEVKIEHIRELNIWRTKRIDRLSNSGTWNERVKIKKSIFKWLDKTSKDGAPLTNAEYIVASWNSNNGTNKIPQSFKD